MITQEHRTAQSLISAQASGDRERLILEHLPQAKLIARRIHERLPISISLDDLVSAGVVGLIAAIDRYDHTHDVKLRTYAEYKIRGAILDTLREMDWAPRSQRRRARMIQSAIAALEQKYQRTPTENEIANQLDVSIPEYHEWLKESHALTVGSVEDGAKDENGRNLLSLLSATADRWPYQIAERAALNGLLAEALESLPCLERKVLTLYYYEEMTLREVADMVDLHESRISQLKTQAILKLRYYMQKRWS